MSDYGPPGPSYGSGPSYPNQPPYPGQSSYPGQSTQAGYPPAQPGYAPGPPSGYGEPQGPPTGYGEPQGPPPPGFGGPPGGGPVGTAGVGMSPSQQVTYLGLAAGVLGLLAFVWGFLDWLTAGSSGASAFENIGAAAVGLALVAGLLAVAAVVEQRPVGLNPAAVSIAAVLLSFGFLVNHPDGADAGIGLILTFITAIVQVAALIVAWLMSAGRIGSIGGGSGATPAGFGASAPWQSQHESGPYPPGGQGFGSGPSGPPSYSPPPSEPSVGASSEPATEPARPATPQTEERPSLQKPQSGEQSTPSTSPPPPPASPPPPPPGPRPGAGSDEDISRTQVIPRYPGPSESTQTGIPPFSPPPPPGQGGYPGGPGRS